MDQARLWTTHDNGLLKSTDCQFAVPPVARSPADDAAREHVDDNGKIQPTLAGPYLGSINIPFLIGAGCCEVLIDDVGRDREGMLAVGRALEPTLLPGRQAIFSHQPGSSLPTECKAAVLQFPCHGWAAIGLMRKRVGRAHMSQHHHVLALPMTCWAVFPGKMAALANAQTFAETVCGEFRFRLVDETELHRLPSLAKKVAARFSSWRSCRRILLSRRNRVLARPPCLRWQRTLSAHPSPDYGSYRSSALVPIGRPPVLRNLTLRPPAHLRQAHRFLLKFLGKVLLLRHSGFLSTQENLSTVPKQVHEGLQVSPTSPPFRLHS